jgi:hypothetical protein
LEPLKRLELISRDDGWLIANAIIAVGMEDGNSESI